MQTEGLQELRAQNLRFCEACKLDPPGLPSEARLRFAGEAVLTKASLLYGARVEPPSGVTGTPFRQSFALQIEDLHAAEGLRTKPTVL